MKRLAVSIIVSLAAYCAAVAGGDGARYDAIVIPADAGPCVKYAAAELQKFLGQACGMTLAIADDSCPLTNRAIIVGRTRHTGRMLGMDFDAKSLGDEGFRLVSRPPHFMIVGSENRGALYGTYEFLERFAGCRWYAPWCSVVPKERALSVPSGFDETQRPALDLREPYWFDMLDGDFAARCKVNGNTMRLGAKHGGKPCRFGGGLGPAHTFMKLVPPKKYFKDHPEYYSLIGGKRVSVNTQLCLTNPDVERIVTEGVLAAIAKDPDAKFYGVGPEDWNNNCGCEKCRAVDEEEGSPAGSLLRFVNRVAEGVERSHPDKIIMTLAYHYTRKPPKHVKARRNVAICLCPIECDYAFPIATGKFYQSRSFREDIKGWAKISDEIYIFDYATDYSWFLHAFPNVLSLRENIKFFIANGVKYVMSLGDYKGRHGDFAELKAWLTAKWAWNPDLPEEALLDDFFAGYYGAGAPYVRRYFDEVHAIQRRLAADGRNPLCVREDVCSDTLSDEFLLRAAKLWKKAENAVKDDPVRLYNVRMGAMSTEFTRLMRIASDATKILSTDGRPPKVDFAEGREMAVRFLKKMEEAKNVRLCEANAGNKEALDAINRLAKGVMPDDIGYSAPMDAFILQKPGDWCEMADDPLADGGRAMKVYGSHHEWCALLRMNRIAFKSGETAHLRFRARVEPKPGAEGEAFWAGVYDLAQRRGALNASILVDHAKKGYVWYDIGDFKPNVMQTIWVGSGRWPKGGEPAKENIYFDRIEIKRVADK